MSDFLTTRKIETLPRLPLSGSLDLTWRCNNNCRHCWVNIPENGASQADELSFDEIVAILKEAKFLGCRNISLSGGEPMLREDFEEIFAFVINNFASYTLNTNATLITPSIAQLMRKPGSKLISIYGADANVHDRITRRRGSYDKMMQGITYLKEAGAKFAIQIVPMRDNLHQYNDMGKFAESLSERRRLGASWLNLAGDDIKRNREIVRQRLSADEILQIESPTLVSKNQLERNQIEHAIKKQNADNTYFNCIKTRNAFYINPYGKMSFCPYVRDNQISYDLRKGSFSEAWDVFLPSLTGKLIIDSECSNCEYSDDCHWCPVYAYLEHGSYTQKIDYLCSIVQKKQLAISHYNRDHCRYFQIGGLKVKVSSHTEINDTTFDSKFKSFRIAKTDDYDVSIDHKFDQTEGLDLDSNDLVYDRIPWRIYKNKNNYIYTLSSSQDNNDNFRLTALTNHDHTQTTIIHRNEDKDLFQKGNIPSLSTFTTDQIILSRVLADRNGLYVHAAGVIMDGFGLLFPGVKEAGKTTISNLLKDHTELLCDDRIILRNVDNLPRIYGTWSHGDLPIVSASSAPLNTILFPLKSDSNRLTKIDDKAELLRNILPLVIRPLISDNWWDKILKVIEKSIVNTPAYYLYFNKDSHLFDLLKKTFGVGL
ncbi:radical SAM protein [bacterium]|nr:radical SAM protein [bacterium]